MLRDLYRNRREQARCIVPVLFCSWEGITDRKRELPHRVILRSFYQKQDGSASPSLSALTHSCNNALVEWTCWRNHPRAWMPYTPANPVEHYERERPWSNDPSVLQRTRCSSVPLSIQTGIISNGNSVGSRIYSVRLIFSRLYKLLHSNR